MSQDSPVRAMSKADQKLYGPLAVQQQQTTLTSALFSSKTCRASVRWVEFGNPTTGRNPKPLQLR